MAPHQVWGKMCYIRNVIYIRISPFEQRTYRGFLADSWRGFRRDFFNNAPYILPAMATVYLITDWGNKENERLKRKNPADYANDT